MRSSDRVDEIAPAWVAALSSLGDVIASHEADIEGKDGRRGFKYKYANIRDVIALARPILAEQRLAVHQAVHSEDRGQVMIECTVWHSSGQWITADPLLMPAPGDARQIGSAITYGRRYALMAFLGLATEDDDGQGALDADREELARMDREREEAEALDKRVRSVLAELVALPEEQQADFKVWKGDRSASGAALHDEGWLTMVEAWLDEHADRSGVQS